MARSATDHYALSLHDALPICGKRVLPRERTRQSGLDVDCVVWPGWDQRHLPRQNCERVELFQDRKSTRLNSSHLVISYAVFCLKKKKHNESRVKIIALLKSKT